MLRCTADHVMQLRSFPFPCKCTANAINRPVRLLMLSFCLVLGTFLTFTHIELENIDPILQTTFPSKYVFNEKCFILIQIA